MVYIALLMRRVFSSLHIFFVSMIFLVSVSAEAVPSSNKKTAARKKENSEVVSFELLPAQPWEEKTFQVIWPQGLKEKALVGITTTLVPQEGERVSFVVSNDIPQRLDKGGSFPVVVRFSPHTTAPKKESPPPVQVNLVIQARKPKSGKSLVLFQRALLGIVVSPPKVVCEKLRDPWVVQSTDTTPGLPLQCRNIGGTALPLVPSVWTCNSPSLVLTSPPMTLNPGESKPLLATRVGSFTPPGEYMCKLSILSEGDLAIQVVPSRIGLKEVSGTGHLSFTEGNWQLRFPATPHGHDVASALLFRPTTATNIQKIQVRLTGEGAGSFQILLDSTVSEEKNGFRISFAPQKSDKIYEAVALLEVTYQEGEKKFKTEQLSVRLLGSSNALVTSQWPLRVFDAFGDSADVRKGTLLEDNVVKEIAGPFYEVWKYNWHTSVPGVKVAAEWPHVMTLTSPFSAARTRLVPFVVDNTLSLYRRSSGNPMEFEQVQVPVRLRLRPKPLHLVVGLYANPGLRLFPDGGLPIGAVRLAVAYDLLNFPTLIPSRRLLLHVGGEMVAGAMAWGIPEQPLGSIPMYRLMGVLKFGGDLTSSQRLALWGKGALGYAYLGPRPNDRQTHNFYFEGGLGLRVRPVEKMPGLYIDIQLLYTQSVNSSVSPMHNVELPIGASLEL